MLLLLLSDKERGLAETAAQLIIHALARHIIIIIVVNVAQLSDSTRA